jgi:hypothetical protein
LSLLAILFFARIAAAAPTFDISTPAAFFTNVASRLLSRELNVSLGQIQIYPTNQYTPAVHRLLQVTANILDAQNTNFYPSVFRPLFSKDAANNVFIIGYQQVTNVSGPSDPQLAAPYPVERLQNFAVSAPITDGSGPINVYGVPWIVGAKQGLPNFNQFYMLASATITRKIEVTRTSLDPLTATYGTNQMYIIGISNNLGVTFWNSYNANYVPHNGSLQVYASDVVSMTLTNTQTLWTGTKVFVGTQTLTAWPGAQWAGTPPAVTANPNSYLPFTWSYVFMSPAAYDFATAQFDPTFQWQSTTPSLPQLPQFGLLITNYLQAYILDGTNVIDYVELEAPITQGGLNQALADPNYPWLNGIYYQWSTNAYPPASQTPFGVINQLWVSGHPNNAPAAGGTWATSPTPEGIDTPAAEAAYFNGFFTPTYQGTDGKTYQNTSLVQQAPYTPTRTVFVPYLLQVNDPLVHYLGSDLSSQAGTLGGWANSVLAANGIWTNTDSPLTLSPPPTVNSGHAVSPARYQPWGRSMLMAAQKGVDANAYNLAYRDPLVWGSDYWNFPTGQSWSLSWLGQVHRGTPWQTIFLKATNVLAEADVGSNTWAAWTGDLAVDANSGLYIDAPNSAPVTDWQLVSLLGALLNTNDLSTQFSVNNSDPNAWEVQMDGLIALTNSSLSRLGPQFTPIVISSNSAQAAIIANAIQSTKASLPNAVFQNIGDILATPELSVHSPFLNTLSVFEYQEGISDQAYEAIPSQFLPLLRTDSIGTMILTNGQVRASFSGYDSQAYAIQVSTDLLNWTSLSTNSPVNGMFQSTLPATGGATSQFYRSLWLP